MAQEQQDKVEQQVPDTEGENTPTPDTGHKKRRKKKEVQLSEEEISPRPSYWPFALALAVSVLLLGLVVHPILLVIGAVLVIAAIIGWGLERR